MKPKLKKLVGLSIAGMMIASTVQTSVFASRSGFASNFNTSDKQVIGNDTIALCGDAAANVDFPSGLAGRGTDDYSARQTFDNTSSSSGFQLMQYASEADTRSKWDRVLYECSMLYSGDADYVQMVLQGVCENAAKPYKITCNISNNAVNLSRYYWQSSYFKSYPNSIKAGKDQWIRLVLDLNTYDYDKKVDLYINGQKFEIDTDNYIRSINSITFTAGFDSVGDGSKKASIAVDDVKVTRMGDYTNTAPYSPSGDQATALTCAVSNTYGLKYDSSLERIVYQSGTTVQNVIDSVTTNAGAVKVLKSSGSFEAVANSSEISSENVLVLVSKDGGTFKYISFVNGDEERIVSYDPMHASSSFTLFGGDTEVGKNTEYGLYAKNQSDVAYTLTASTPVSIRTNYMMAIPESMFELDSFTFEFSLALDGVLDEVSLANFASTKDVERFAYNNPVRFKNGALYVNDNGSDKYIRNYRNGEWYRIGITYYPKELKQDIYVNGKKEISKGWVVSNPDMCNPELYQISSLMWNNIAVKYSSMGTGKVAIDDTLLYTGEHFDPSKYIVTVNPDILTVGSKANDIYIDDIYSMTISDLIEDLNISADIEPAIYADNSYSADAEDLGYGNVLVLTSNNGYVKEYYTILPSDIKIDNEIKCYVNGTEGVVLPAKTDEAYSADICIKAGGFAPAYMDNVTGCLVFAVYDGDRLVDVIYDDKQIISDTSFRLDYTVNEPANFKAKAFFFDSLQQLKPYAAAKTITSAE